MKLIIIITISYIILSLIIGVVSLKLGKKRIGEEDYDMCTGDHWIIDKDVVIDDAICSAIFSPLILVMFISLLPIKILELIFKKLI